MDNINQKINGSNNVQVGGDFIKTDKIIRRTEVIYNPEEHITDSQAKEIKDRVKKIAEETSGDSRNKSASPYALAYRALYNRYKITKYTLLPKGMFDDAIKWLDKQIAINRPKLKNVNNEQYRIDLYKAIHTRSKQLEIDIYEFATIALELKKPIQSLKDLSDTRLNKLYKKVFSVKKKQF